MDAKTQEFLEGICKTADKQIKAGNPAMLNRLGVNPSVNHYYNNVFKLKAITFEQWERDYPALAAGAATLREEYDAQLEARAEAETLKATVVAMEAGLKQLTKVVEDFVAASAKPSKKKAEPEEQAEDAE